MTTYAPRYAGEPATKLYPSITGWLRENRHPSQFDDARAAFDWATAKYDHPIILAGDFAGGNLAAAICHAARGLSRQPIGQVLIYPGLGGDRAGKSYQDHANAPMLTVRDLEFYKDVRMEGILPARLETLIRYQMRIFPQLFSNGHRDGRMRSTVITGETIATASWRQAAGRGGMRSRGSFTAICARAERLGARATASRASRLRWRCSGAANGQSKHWRMIPKSCRLFGQRSCNKHLERWTDHEDHNAVPAQGRRMPMSASRCRTAARCLRGSGCRRTLSAIRCRRSSRPALPKRDGTTARDSLTHPYFAGNGYASIRVDMRGNGDSEGLMEDEYSEQELDDACNVIAWAAAQPWCNGNVGMMGISWGGFNSLQVAAKQPPALKAIITLCSTDDRYADDIHYKGGLPAQ